MIPQKAYPFCVADITKTSTRGQNKSKLHTATFEIEWIDWIALLIALIDWFIDCIFLHRWEGSFTIYYNLKPLLDWQSRQVGWNFRLFQKKEEKVEYRNAKRARLAFRYERQKLQDTEVKI